MKRFLTAKWLDLLMANYAVKPELLKSRVPPGTELDIFEDKCFVSVVAFQFVDTKVLGIPVPGHTDFEEVNLRFYVTYKAESELRRGVVFVKEIVPKSMITFVARTVYGEPYETWSMSHIRTESELTYNWSDSEIANRMHVEIGENLGKPGTGSVEEFITEHYWGYTKRGDRRTDEYRVAHPKWDLFDLNYAELEINFGETYGHEFEFLNDAEPHSLLLAKGSEIEVYKGKKLRVQ